MRKIVIGALTMLIAIVLTGIVHAEVLVTYTAGVAAATGQAGANDPADQGWTYQGDGSASSWSGNYDSGDGGWRTVDGSMSFPSQYHRDITSVTNSLQDDWELTWTLSLDSDAIKEDGETSSGFYAPPNNGNMNSLYMIVETANHDSILLSHQVDSNSDLYINDGTTNHVLTSDGSAFDFHDLKLAHDSNAGTYTLSIDGSGSYSIDTWNSHRNNTMYWGSGSSGGQGSAVWNEVELIPEPATFGLLGLLGIVYLIRRRLVKS